MSTIYWSAYYGLTEYVRWILIARKWSPFIKSFKRRSVLAATICGKQIETAKMLLSYTYEPMKNGSNTREPDQTKASFFRVFGKDFEGNNVLHLCGLNRMPEIHKMLRESEFMLPYKKNKTMTLKSRR